MGAVAHEVDRTETGQGHAVVIEDDQLVQRTVAGDRAAFESLVERHGPVVYRVAARIVGSQDADDVSQDALIRAFHRLGQYRGDSSFDSWLLRIVHNTALDFLRRRRPVPVGSADDHDENRVVSTGGERVRQPVGDLEERERRERLVLKLRELRVEHRAVLVLRDLEGLSYQEIAEVTDSPIGSVRGRLHRARNEMVDIMRSNTYDWELPE
jgi:RNA polymerase sigma-70 factor, ECF subfamily